MHPSVIYPFEERLAKHTCRVANGCLLWTGSKVGRGYGKMTVNKRTVRVHRAVWAHHHGPIDSHELVMHECDTPSCVEIAHLVLGSSQDNSEDMTQKGRQAKGHKVASSKLSGELIVLARRLALTLPQAEVARIVGISKTQMHRIFHQQNWTHV